jgi:hypothetical protein
MKLHLNTLTMNLCPDGLRWQRFTGVMIGRRMLGVFRDCDIDHETALAEYERTWGLRHAAGVPTTKDGIRELKKRGLCGDGSA